MGKPLRIPSRLPNIFSDDDPEPGFHPKGELSIDRLPASAQSTYHDLSPSEGYATLSAFLSMEAYFPVSKFQPETSFLCYLLRVEDAAAAIETQLIEKNAVSRFLLGLDALAQLSRVPDILTAPACCDLFQNALALRTHATQFHRQTESIIDETGRVFEETFSFLEQFYRVQQKASVTSYSNSFEERYFRWALLIDAWLRNPEKWHDEAEDLISDFQANRDDLDSIPRLDTRAEFKSLRPMIYFYAETLRLNDILLDLSYCSN